MTFLSPAYLWGLLALLPLIAVYFLRVRPRRRPVTAFFLWQKVLERKKASSLFQRLRDAFSLLLLILAVAAAVLAAAGLRFQQNDERDLVVFLDVTPSMMARDSLPKGKTMLDLARTHAADMVKAMNGTRRIAIGTVADDLQFASHLSDSPKDLQDAIRMIQASDLKVSARAIASINDYADRSKNRYRVILLTDGQGAWKNLSPNVEVVRLGSSAKTNTGIIAADLEWSGNAGDRARFFYQVATSSAGEIKVDLELRNEESQTSLRLIPLTLTKNQTLSDTIEIEGAEPGRWMARLLTQDALASDNEVAMGLPERKPVQLKVDIADSYFYKRCVEAFEIANGALQLNESDPEIVVSQGTATDAPRSVIFAPKGNSPYWSNAEEAVDVLIAEPKIPDHPVLKNIDCDALRFAGAKKAVPTTGSLVLLASESGQALIWKSEVAGKSAVVINLDPTEEEFFLSPWFPVIIHNAATHLAGRNEIPRATLATGTVTQQASGATKPDGSTQADDTLVVEQRGHWRSKVNNWFGAAVFSAEETVLDGSGPQASAKETDSGHPLLLWLIWLALALLMAEVFLYHRRMVG